MSQLFEPVIDHNSMQHAPMGQRTSAGRYKMPLMPGEVGPKGGGDWVSSGLQSMTNLASSISDTKALGQWEIEQVLIGLGLHSESYRDLRFTVQHAVRRGVNLQELRLSEGGRYLRDELALIAEKAKDIGGANTARDAGIVRHDAWQEYGETGSTQLFTDEIAGVRALLDAAGFEIIPDLCERTVRNLAIKAAGRFDNILMHRRSGRLIMADLKTKAKPFWTWLEMDGQLAGYANSELMLTTKPLPQAVEYGAALDTLTPDYEDGPKALGVDLTEGVILHMPSRPDENGSQEPRLRRADLVDGWRTMQLAREVCTQRSRGRSAGRGHESWWPTS